MLMQSLPDYHPLPDREAHAPACIACSGNNQLPMQSITSSKVALAASIGVQAGVAT